MQLAQAAVWLTLALIVISGLGVLCAGHRLYCLKQAGRKLGRDLMVLRSLGGMFRQRGSVLHKDFIRVSFQRISLS